MFGPLVIYLMILFIVLTVAFAGARRRSGQADARAGHDDRDYACKYWYGDRGGYDIHAVRCPICNPEETA